MIRHTSIYAIRALTALARTPSEEVPVRQLANRAEVPAAFLGKIMGVLARRGLVSSRRGKCGGSRLLRPASTITLYDVCAALEDPAILSLCLLSGRPCRDDAACPAHHFWQIQQAGLIRFLKNTTIQDMAEHDRQRAAITCHAKPAAPAKDGPETAMVTLVCGPSGAGKTMYCRQAVERARQAGRHVAGILSLSDPPEGRRRRIVLHDLSTGAVRVLAHQQPPAGTTAIRSGGWWFSQATIAWANEVFRAACPCDLFVVDEIGPLEVKHNEGFTEALAALDRRQYSEALVTTRTTLLSSLRERLPWAEVICVSAPGTDL